MCMQGTMIERVEHKLGSKGKCPKEKAQMERKQEKWER